MDAKILEGNPKWRAKKAHLFNFYSETKIQIMQRSRLTKLKYVSTYTGTYFDERVCSCWGLTSSGKTLGGQGVPRILNNKKLRKYFKLKQTPVLKSFSLLFSVKHVFYKSILSKITSTVIRTCFEANCNFLHQASKPEPWDGADRKRTNSAALVLTTN